jgi:hypothetical protein
MKQLQQFEEQNHDKLMQFLEEHNPGHDDIQIKHFIIEKNGITDYGKYKQCLAELYTYYKALKTYYFKFKKNEAKIKVLEARRNELTDSEVDKAKAGLIDVKIEEKEYSKMGIEKSMQRSLNEMIKHFEMAKEYEKKIEGKDRTKLMIDFWEKNLEKQLEINTIWGGGNLAGAIETIDSLPEDMKGPLYEKAHGLRILSHKNQLQYLENAKKAQSGSGEIIEKA